MKRIKKLFAMIAIAFLLVPVSVMVLPTSFAFGTCVDCVPDNGGYVCAGGFAQGWYTCIDAPPDDCWVTDGRCSIFE